jgi:hypothetical protein
MRIVFKEMTDADRGDALPGSVVAVAKWVASLDGGSPYLAGYGQTQDEARRELLIEVEDFCERD